MKKDKKTKTYRTSKAKPKQANEQKSQKRARKWVGGRALRTWAPEENSSRGEAWAHLEGREGAWERVGMGRGRGA